MLVQEVAQKYGDKVRFIVEDLGASKLADSFGVDKYPAIFVDDALVARPEDFYEWGGPPTGRYIPWKELANRRRFQADLQQMIDIRLAGGTVASLPASAKTAAEKRLLPDVALEGLDGKTFRLAELRGKPVIIEFWAPWCPHCLNTLEWLKKLDSSKVEIVAIAIESPRADIVRAVEKLAIPGRVVFGSTGVREAFGGPPAIPTLLVAGSDGAIARIFYGAPPTLHADIESELAKLAAPRQAKTFRSVFGEARKALEAGDNAGYLAKMQEAMTLEHDRSGRPFYQYHLARAFALNGKNDEAAATLETAWNERIEGPMIVFADSDPAFANVRKTPEYAKVRALFDALEIKLTPAGGSVFEIEGAGCTLAASIGSDGILLVDSGYPRTAPALLRALKKQAGVEPRVRFIVNTHGHYDHAASNAEAGPAATVIAHAAAAEEMKSGSDFVPGHRIPPVDDAALPDETVERPRTIAFNGETVHIIPLPAHTAGDLVIWFERSKVLHMGDDYFGADSTQLYPGPKPAAFFATLGDLLATVPDDAAVLSGHAARVPASTLKATFANSLALFQFVRDAIASGTKPEAIVEDGVAKGYARPWVERYLRWLTK